MLGCVGSGQAAKRTLALGTLGRYGPKGSHRSVANPRQRARRFAGVPASRIVLQKSMSDVRREEAHRRFRPRCRDARIAGESAASRETRSWAGPRRQNRGISEASEEDDSSMEGGPGQFEAGAPSRESRGSWSRSSRRGASCRESGHGARRGDDGSPRWFDRSRPCTEENAAHDSSDTPPRIVHRDLQDPLVSVGETHATPAAERDVGARSLTIVGCKSQVARASGHAPDGVARRRRQWPSVTETVETLDADDGGGRAKRVRACRVGILQQKPARHATAGASPRQQHDDRRSRSGGALFLTRKSVRAPNRPGPWCMRCRKARSARAVRPLRSGTAVPGWPQGTSEVGNVSAKAAPARSTSAGGPHRRATARSSMGCVDTGRPEAGGGE